MTIIYFVRHAEPNYSNHDDRARELSLKGMEDRKGVAQFLRDKKIDVVMSSPYKRAVDTVKKFADESGLPVELIEDFRERKIDNIWIEDFQSFAKRQWEDFDYKLSDGESLREVQRRNIAALESVLEQYRDKHIVIGSHGTALSTVINYFDPGFGYKEFDAIRRIMPWIVRFEFEDKRCVSIDKCAYAV